MHIRSFSFRHIPPFDFIQFECDKHANVFIGPNASGKTTALRVLRDLCSLGSEHRKGPSWFSYSGTGGTSYSMLTSEDWLLNEEEPDGGKKWGKVPCFQIPATRIHLPRPGLPESRSARLTPDAHNSPLIHLFDTDSGVFHGQLVQASIDFLREDGPVMRETRHQLRKAIHLGYSCSKEICAEIVLDDAPHPFVELQDTTDTHDRTMVVHHAMGVVTSDDVLGDPLYAGALSAGTQGTLLWIWALALHMVNYYGWTEGWEKKPAILLIDEIENHLHPTWQRRVIPALLKHFPGLQIFATTHSPFVVAGLKAGQVHLLKRDEQGRVTASTNTEDIVGWTADEILRTMMGVDDPTDDVTAGYARQLRALRKEGPYDDEAAEAQRQAKIQELRQYVNRDLLAGGPMAAQRELFEEHLAKALERYRKSRDLNQENN